MRLRLFKAQVTMIAAGNFPNRLPTADSVVLAHKVRGKIKQNLFRAATYNLIAIPVAPGALYPSLGVLLRPEWAALAISDATFTVALNALILNRVRRSKRWQGLRG
jgi:Cu2+-exporting ATPase